MVGWTDVRRNDEEIVQTDRRDAGITFSSTGSIVSRPRLRYLRWRCCADAGVVGRQVFWETIGSVKVAIFLFTLMLACASVQAADGLLPVGPWAKAGDGSVAASFVIRGSEARGNPLRQELAEPFEGDALYVRFRLRYDAAGLDVPPEDEGEFFVLWLDAIEGGEAAAHSGGVPNIGVHVKDGKANHFMARFTSGAANEVYGPALVGDREYLLVARLAKSQPGQGAPFDLLDLWVDPKVKEGGDAAPKPDASVSYARSISSVNWIGFATGMKTEAEDRIRVGDIAVATDWGSITGVAGAGEPAVMVEKLTLEEIPDPPSYVAEAAPEIVAKVGPAQEMTTDHWSFQKFSRPDIPLAAAAAEGEDGESSLRTPIDVFLAKAQADRGVRPMPLADDDTLRRRMALTITGLPPTREPGEELDADAYAEKLLASPQFGERWGRMWLDVARWAESNGHQHNRDRAHAWKYRDWVIDAMNRDLPYDRFVRHQIAGDEVEPFVPEQVVATGFLAAARYSGNELDKQIQRTDILVDVVNTTSKAFLGLTMECAQCHDHFFDPVTQWDYFNLMAFFAQGQPDYVILEEENERVEDLVRKRWGLFESVRARKLAALREAGNPEPVLLSPENVPKAMTRTEKRTFDRIDAEIKKLPKAWAFFSPATSPHQLEVAPNTMRWPLPYRKESLADRTVRFLDRGDAGSPGPVAKPAWPKIFGEASAAEENRIAERPRSALADWLTDPDHPLVARAWVNRIWQGYFGRGLVATSGDFGVAGAEPDHPELLDWLASELIDSGWSSKHIHRLILRSNAFRRSSQFLEANAQRDEDNETLWRWRPRRLEAEAIRDSVLAVAGELDLKSGGPSVPRSEQEKTRRRAVYLQQRRDNLPHQQMLFDGANAVTSCARRDVSTVSLQPLWMLNSEFMQEMAEKLAGKVEAQEAAAQADELVELAWNRKADAEERAQLKELIRGSSLSDAAMVVLNANEFLYIP